MLHATSRQTETEVQSRGRGASVGKVWLLLKAGMRFEAVQAEQQLPKTLIMLVHDESDMPY